MKDKNVELKVKEFISIVNDLNAIWSDLQRDDDYIRLENSEIPGTKVKTLAIKEIKQSVTYFIEEKNYV